MKRRSFLRGLLALAAAPIAIAKAVAAAASRSEPIRYIWAPYMPMYTTPALMLDEERQRRFMMGYKGADFRKGFYTHISLKLPDAIAREVASVQPVSLDQKTLNCLDNVLRGVK